MIGVHSDVGGLDAFQSPRVRLIGPLLVCARTGTLLSAFLGSSFTTVGEALALKCGRGVPSPEQAHRHKRRDEGGASVETLDRSVGSLRRLRWWLERTRFTRALAGK